MMNRGKLYRSPNGKFMGVCSGLADWLNMDIGLVRLGFIIAFFISGGIVFFVYLGLGIFLPVSTFDESDSIYENFRNDFKDGSRKENRSSRVTVADVKKEFDNLKSRVSKMEDSVFNKERDWDERFKRS